MSSYWLGVATLPAVALTLFLLFVAYVIGVEVLDMRFGVVFEGKWRRNVEGVSDHLLQRDVWWERSFGPVFVGGWYREEPRYGAPDHRRFNRWVGVGRVNGPCLMAFRRHDLGPVAT